jgi:hypothetical protein
MPPLPIAHAGHWIAGLLYLVPVVIVVAALAWQSLRDRGSADIDEDDGPAASE